MRDATYENIDFFFLKRKRGSCEFFFFFSSRRRHTILTCDWSSDVCSSDLAYLFWEDQRDGLGLDANVRCARVPYDASLPGANFRVNSSTLGRQGTPSAVWDGRDAFLAAWEDSRNGAPDVYAISILPNGTRRGFDTQLNDDAARNDQWAPRLGHGAGEYVLTWIDRRNSSNDLFSQWVATNGGREGTNTLIYSETTTTRAVASNAAVAQSGVALLAAQVTR